MKDRFTIIYPLSYKKKMQAENIEPTVDKDKSLQLQQNKKTSWSFWMKERYRAFRLWMAPAAWAARIRRPYFLFHPKGRWGTAAVMAIASGIYFWPQISALPQQLAQNQAVENTAKLSGEPLVKAQKASFVSSELPKTTQAAAPLAMAQEEKEEQPATAEENKELSSENLPQIPEIQPTVKKPVSVEISDEKLQKQLNFMNRLRPLAENEAAKTKIPAALLLGLAIMQSDFGQTAVAKAGNNPFHLLLENNSLLAHEGCTGEGIFHGQRYARYRSLWAGFKAHSLYLQSLEAPKENSCSAWAKALEEQGYFQKDQNAQKLIDLIKGLELEKPLMNS